MAPVASALPKNAGSAISADDSSSEDIPPCPLCMEDLDETDRDFYPCPCDYQVCLWCLEYLKTNMGGRCPACRQPYEESKYRYLQSKPSELLRRNLRSAKQKESMKQSNASRDTVSAQLNSTRLKDIRVIQRNLCYVLGLPPSIARKENLRRPEFFGRYGSISNIVVSRTPSSVSCASYSAYVTYTTAREAIDAIKDIDGCSFEGSVLRASFGTTKYCSFFLRGVQCSKPDCFYLHHLGDEQDSFTREKMVCSRTAFTDLALARSEEQTRSSHPPSLFRLQSSEKVEEEGDTTEEITQLFGKPVPPLLLKKMAELLKPEPTEKDAVRPKSSKKEWGVTRPAAKDGLLSTDQKLTSQRTDSEEEERADFPPIGEIARVETTKSAKIRSENKWGKPAPAEVPPEPEQAVSSPPVCTLETPEEAPQPLLEEAEQPVLVSESSTNIDPPNNQENTQTCAESHSPLEELLAQKHLSGFGGVFSNSPKLPPQQDQYYGCRSSLGPPARALPTEIDGRRAGSHFPGFSSGHDTSVPSGHLSSPFFPAGKGLSWSPLEGKQTEMDRRSIQRREWDAMQANGRLEPPHWEPPPRPPVRGLNEVAVQQLRVQARMIEQQIQQQIQIRIEQFRRQGDVRAATKLESERYNLTATLLQSRLAALIATNERATEAAAANERLLAQRRFLAQNHPGSIPTPRQFPPVYRGSEIPMDDESTTDLSSLNGSLLGRALRMEKEPRTDWNPLAGYERTAQPDYPPFGGPLIQREMQPAPRFLEEKYDEAYQPRLDPSQNNKSSHSGLDLLRSILPNANITLASSPPFQPSQTFQHQPPSWPSPPQS